MVAAKTARDPARVERRRQVQGQLLTAIGLATNRLLCSLLNERKPSLQSLAYLTKHIVRRAECAAPGTGTK